MNKRTIIASLNDIANELDSAQLYKESNEILSVMKKLAMPVDRNQMMFEEISASLSNFNRNVGRLEDEMGNLNRVLRVMQESIYDRRPNTEDILTQRRKLQETFEEIRKYNQMLGDDMTEIKRLSSMASNSLQESNQPQNNQSITSTQPEEDLSSNSDFSTDAEDVMPERVNQRRQFRN